MPIIANIVTIHNITIGKYNTTVTDSLFVVGNGTSTSAKKNAFYIPLKTVFPPAFHNTRKNN